MTIQSTGNPDIDGTHLIIIEKLESIIKCINKKQHKSISNFLEELFRIVSSHFKDEEELMQSIEYPYAATHIAAHNDIIVKLLHLMQNYSLPTKKIEWILSSLLVLLHKHVEYYDVSLFTYNTRLV